MVGIGISDDLLAEVTSYVWRAAKAFYEHKEHREAFVQERLLRILRGEVSSVVTGLRRMASVRGLEGSKREEVATVCGHFEGFKA